MKGQIKISKLWLWLIAILISIKIASAVKEKYCFSCFYDSAPYPYIIGSLWLDRRLNKDDKFYNKPDFLENKYDYPHTKDCLGDPKTGALDKRLAVSCNNENACRVVYIRNNFKEFAVIRRCATFRYDEKDGCKNARHNKEPWYNNIHVHHTECFCTAGENKDKPCNEDALPSKGPKDEDFPPHPPDEEPKYDISIWEKARQYCHNCWYDETGSNGARWTDTRTGFVNDNYFSAYELENTPYTKECLGDSEGKISRSGKVKWEKCQLSHFNNPNRCIKVLARNNFGKAFVVRRCDKDELGRLGKVGVYRKEINYTNVVVKSDLVICNKQYADFGCNDDQDGNKGPEGSEFDPIYEDPDYEDTLSEYCYECYYDSTGSDGKNWKNVGATKNFNSKDWRLWDNTTKCVPDKNGTDKIPREFGKQYCRSNMCTKFFTTNRKGDYFVVRRCAYEDDARRFEFSTNDRHKCEEFEWPADDGYYPDGISLECICSNGTRCNDNQDRQTIPIYPGYPENPKSTTDNPLKPTTKRVDMENQSAPRADPLTIVGYVALVVSIVLIVGISICLIRKYQHRCCK